MSLHLVPTMIALLAFVAQAQASVEITLKSEAQVGARQYFIRDIAEVTSPDPRQAERVRNVRVGEAVRLGVDELVARSRIGRLLAAGVPDMRGQIVWRGEEAVRIKWLATTIRGEDLLETARAQLTGSLSSTAPGVKIEQLALPQETLVPSGGLITMRARLAPDAPLSRRMCVWVDILSDGRIFRSIPIWFAVSAPATVWVARKSISAGKGLDAVAMREERGDLAQLGGVPIAPSAVPAGWRLRKTLPTGAALTTASIEVAPPVARNQLVQVRSRIGAVSIESTAMAAEDGQVGKRIRLINQATRQEYVGRVVAAGSALVE